MDGAVSEGVDGLNLMNEAEISASTFNEAKIAIF